MPRPCKVCQFFHEGWSNVTPREASFGIGECRRHAPYGGNYTHRNTAFAVVAEDDWCGEFVDRNKHPMPRTARAQARRAWAEDNHDKIVDAVCRLGSTKLAAQALGFQTEQVTFALRKGRPRIITPDEPMDDQPEESDDAR